MVNKASFEPILIKERRIGIVKVTRIALRGIFQPGVT